MKPPPHRRGLGFQVSQRGSEKVWTVAQTPKRYVATATQHTPGIARRVTMVKARRVWFVTADSTDPTLVIKEAFPQGARVTTLCPLPAGPMRTNTVGLPASPGDPITDPPPQKSYGWAAGSTIAYLFLWPDVR